MNSGSAISLQSAFAAAVREHADRIALEQDGVTLTYAALDARSDGVAALLLAAGVQHGDRVALYAQRSIGLVAAVLGIVKAGAAYVPLDPAYPVDRQRLMLAGAGAKVLLADQPPPPGVAGGERVLLLADAPAAAPAGAGASGPEDLAYVMFTSGSTGSPKGVMVPHRAVLRLVLGSTFATFGPDTTFLLLSPTSFDASTLELWGPLLNGGRLAIAPPGAPSLADVGRAISRYRVTTLWLTAGLFHAMAEERLADLAPLRELLAGGDVLSPPHVERVLAAHPRLRLINGYGPTENTTFSLCHTIRTVVPGRSIPIGTPIEGTACHLLDPAGQPVRGGAEGELLVSGLGLALGYLGQPELTAEKFVQLASGERAYRTGDRARQLPDGTYEFLGRIDEQLKVRGFRIEPGEVEAALAAHPQIREAAAGVREAAPGDKRLVAWFVPRTPGVVTAQALRAFLSERVPDFLVPSALREVAALPLTTNGKVDRRALPDPFDRGAPASLPAEGVERELAAIWSAVLNREGVGPDENFFEIGGTSLHLARVHERLEKKLGLELQITRLFQYPTVTSLARHLAQRGGADDLGARAVGRADKQRAALAARAAQMKAKKP
jgi:amino acid adenylation domain-containing protein